MSEPLRYVHVEDSEADAELIRETLAAEGYDCTAVRVETRQAFDEAIGREAFDLVISDFALPSFDGLSALAIALERKPGTPFILVSGTLGEEQAIESLKRGATDYVLKHRLTRLGPAVRRALEEARTRRERRRAEEAESLLVAQLRQAQREDLLGNLHDLAEAAARGRQMIKKLLAFSRRESLALWPTDLGAVVQEAVATFRHLLPTSINVTLVVAPGLPAVLADPGAVEQILLNLASNARDALSDGGRLHVAVERRTVATPRPVQFNEVPPGEFVNVAVRDDGVGMDETTRRRVFEPLFTTKPAGKGTGLGMAMVLSLVRQHHGFVAVESAPGRGTKIDLYFPVAARSEEAAAAPAAAPVPLGGTETILVADDDAAVRRVCVRALQHFGHQVLATADGAEALTALHAQGGKVALIISDMTMPRMTGLELYRRLRSEGSTAKFLFTSGDELSLRELAADPNLRVLQKPWTIEELARAVRGLLGAAAGN